MPLRRGSGHASRTSGNSDPVSFLNGNGIYMAFHLALLSIVLLLLTSCSSSSRISKPTGNATTRDVCVGGQQYGVAISDTFGLEDNLGLMGAEWYLDYSIDTHSIPSGCNKALKLKVNAAPSDKNIVASAQARPGSYWIIGNEPNVPGQDEITPEGYADAFQKLRTKIKEADPSAQIVAPEILNFNTTCVACSGFDSGKQWLEDFRTSYKNKYGGEPPIDVWSVHTYDLNWSKMPMLNYESQIQEIKDFREYVNTISEYRDSPIWLTEFAVVWGYDGIQWLPDEKAKSGISQGEGTPLKAHPVGELRVDLMSEYLKSTLDWLENNSKPMNIQKWFIFSSHGYKEPWAAAPGGIALRQDNGLGPELTTIGTIYKNRSTASINGSK
ncbi:MAG: hypothetical protein EXR50_08015 [Dehalococcoidia bacterium]|nr:hypothetical protein [Dehalococcoidia bacterium]